MKVNLCLINIVVWTGVLYSCMYKAGNRHSDLGISVPVSVNSYYIEKYLIEKWMKPIYENPLNSELINYPKDYVPLRDSVGKLIYIIELRVSNDSLHNDGWGLTLSSIFHI